MSRFVQNALKSLSDVTKLLSRYGPCHNSAGCRGCAANPDFQPQPKAKSGPSSSSCRDFTALCIGNGYSQVLFQHVAFFTAFRMGLFLVLWARSGYSNSAYLVHWYIKQFHLGMGDTVHRAKIKAHWAGMIKGWESSPSCKIFLYSVSQPRRLAYLKSCWAFPGL